MIVIIAGLGNLPAVAISGMGLGIFEEWADYLLGTEFRIAAVFSLLVLILVYRRFKLIKKKRISKIMNKNTILYAGLIIFGLAGAFIFPAYKLQMSFLYILIVLAMTWDVQGGQMGYNTFGNILFFGVGMYVASSTQIAMFFSLAEWTDAGGEKTFVHTSHNFFKGLELEYC